MILTSPPMEGPLKGGEKTLKGKENPTSRRRKRYPLQGEEKGVLDNARRGKRFPEEKTQSIHSPP